MAKPRDYKTENARRTSALTAKGSGDGISHWRMSNTFALRRIFTEDQYQKLTELVVSGVTKDGDLYKLLEVARVSPEVAVALLDQPAKIDFVYRNNKAVINRLRTRRVSASERIDRSWDAQWNRWLQKFDPEDWQLVRKECARRILTEYSEAAEHA